MTRAPAELIAEIERGPSGPQVAAFFDLDRTLISGSSAFSFGIAAWRAELMPTRRLLRDAIAALSFRFSGSTDEKAVQVRASRLSVPHHVSQSLI